MEVCVYCNAEFKTRSYLHRHQVDASYCRKYRDVMFICRKCGFKTLGLKTIEAHLSNCDADGYMIDPNNDSVISQLREERQALLVKITSLEEHVRKLQVSEAKLQAERLRVLIYKDIIEKNTSIKVSDVIEEESDGYHVYAQDGFVPVFIHDYIKGCSGPITAHKIGERKKIRRIVKKNPLIEQPVTQVEQKTSEDEQPRRPVENVSSEIVPSEVVEEQEDNTENVKTKKKPVFKVMTNLAVREEPTEEEIANIVRDVDIERHTDTYVGDTVEKMAQSQFDSMRKGRVYTKALESLCSIQHDLLKKMTITAYTDMLRNHLKQMQCIFAAKDYSEKRIVSIVSKIMNGLDQRLLRYGNYYSSTLEVDDINKYRECLERSIIHPTCYVPFDASTIIENLNNYGLALFTIKKALLRCLFNCYGFNNVIYMQTPKSTETDPFSFYVLEKVEPGKRCWKMDCRLEDLTTKISDRMATVMVSMYRCIYFDVFGDNEYRKEYMSVNPVTEYDCEQLIQNLFFISDKRKLGSVLKEIVAKNATYVPTKLDKFNLFGDDTLQKRRMASPSDNSHDVKHMISCLFDGISVNDINDFYDKRM